MTKEVAVCLALDRLEYSLQATTARCSGLRKRIYDEWVLGNPAGKLYGNPPIMLSKNLTREMVDDVLSSLSNHILSCSKYAQELTKET